MRYLFLLYFLFSTFIFSFCETYSQSMHTGGPYVGNAQYFTAGSNFKGGNNYFARTAAGIFHPVNDVNYRTPSNITRTSSSASTSQVRYMDESNAGTMGSHNVLKNSIIDTAFTIAGKWATEGECLCVADTGNYMLVSDYDDSLKMFDISNPASPVELDVLGTPVWVTNILISGHYAFAADAVDSILVYDISDPAKIIEVGSVYLPNASGISDLALADSTISASAENGIYVVNVSNPKAPLLIAYSPGWDYGLGVAAEGNVSYLANGKGGLMIFSGEKSGTATMVGQIGQNLSFGYVTSVGLKYPYAFVVGDNGLYVVNVSNPANPVEVGNAPLLSVQDGPTKGPVNPNLKIRRYLPAQISALLGGVIAFSGNYMFISRGAKGVEVLDISNPTAPYEAATFVPDSNIIPQGVALSDKYVLIPYLNSVTDAGGGFILGTDLITGIKNFKKGSTYAESFILSQNFPNPFNPATTIEYELPSNGTVTLKVYDVLGKVVKTLVNQYENKGRYDVNFNANNLSSGIYFYRLRVVNSNDKLGNYVSTKKMLLLK